MTTLLSTKDVDEEVILTFDFTDGLASGEALTSIVSTEIVVNSGVDANVALVLNGSPNFYTGNSAVSVPVKGGLADCSYKVKVTCDTTNAEKRLTVTAILPMNR